MNARSGEVAATIAASIAPSLWPISPVMRRRAPASTAH